jgi:hypothetical protein
MPNAQVQPLFDEAKKLGWASTWATRSARPRARATTPRILVGTRPRSSASTARSTCRATPTTSPRRPFQHLEKKFFEVGDLGFRVFDTMGARFGMCLCNDRRWPETYRVMALQSAEVVVLGYNTPSLNIHWDEPVHLRTTTHLMSLQANAYQNCVWVAAAAKCGSEDGHHMIGSSPSSRPPARSWPAR